MAENDYSPGPIHAEGCVFDDFLLTDHLPPDQAPAVIERDRLIMSARPGFNRKLLPLRVEQETGKVYSGGRYLLHTYEDAVAFADWCANDFAIDGVLILERPDFAEVTAQVYRVIGAHDFKDVHTSQLAYRTEVWKTGDRNAEDKLVNLWPALRDRAAEEDRSALWLLHNTGAGEVAMVTVIDSVGVSSPGEPDYGTLNAAETMASYGGEWNWAEKTFERSHWVFTIWFPNTGDIHAKPPIWPNSPPLPAPQGISAAQAA